MIGSWLAGLVLLLSAFEAGAQSYPFVGAWGGGPTDCSDPFRFTATSYKPPGAKEMTIQRVVREGPHFRLFFAGGYEVGLSSVTADSLEWLSGASGDSFTLRRCR